jgi:transcriptional regulator with XRE-family HTH domain
MPESIDARRKTIGLLIRRARETAGRSRKDCAAYIGVSPAQMVKYEEGSREPAFIELEALAHYLRAPVQALLDETAAEKLVAPRMGFDIREVIRLRTHIVGTRLKQARLNKELSPKQLGEMVGIPTAQINAYELGKRPIPITELERLIDCLEISLHRPDGRGAAATSAACPVRLAARGGALIRSGPACAALPACSHAPAQSRP